MSEALISSIGSGPGEDWVRQALLDSDGTVGADLEAATAFTPAGAALKNPRAAARMADFAVSGHFWGVLGRGTGPKGEKMAAACPGVDSQDLATILDPFRAIFADLGPDRLSAT